MSDMTDLDHAAARRWIPVLTNLLGIHSALLELDRIEPTDCDDCLIDKCNTPGSATYRYGRLNLCARCARSRAKAAAKVAVLPAAAADDDIPF